MCKIMDISIGYALPILPVNQYLDQKKKALSAKLGKVCLLLN